jgi:crotonobetainyl-CoA:carnitine CoA-transferase CaiB-like acyl-CoA transferase
MPLNFMMGRIGMTSALEGIKVIDLSQVAAVPMCARHLADFGADVIHIENPVNGDSWRSFQEMHTKAMTGVPSQINYNWETYNRNKRSMALDVAKEDGRKVLDRMIEKADVFLCNLRESDLERYHLNYADLSRVNRRIICGYVSGFGRKGPDKGRPAYDTTAYWARSGIPFAFSAPGVPVLGYRAAFGDNLVALALAYGILMALLVREKTGVGQEIDVALLHAGMYQLSFDIAGALATGLDFPDWRESPPQSLVEQAQAVTSQVAAFYASKGINPLAAAYTTKDLRRIMFLSLQPDRYWEKFCLAIDRKDLADDPRYQTIDGRAQYNMALRQTIGETFLTRTYAEWIPRLKGLPCAPVQTVKEAVNDPQARAAGYFISYDHPQFGKVEDLASPVNMSQTPASYRMPAPELGQHTQEVLFEYGYTEEDVVRLKEQGIIL